MADLDKAVLWLIVIILMWIFVWPVAAFFTALAILEGIIYGIIYLFDKSVSACKKKTEKAA